MAVALLNDLIAYYAFESQNPIPDLHTNSIDLLIQGVGVNIEAGGLLGNRSRGTQNTSNYAEALHDNLLQPTAAGMTVAGWGRVPNGTLTLNHVGLAHYANTDRGWIWWGQNAAPDAWAMSASNDGTTRTTSAWGSSYLVDTWYFVVGFLDPANDRVGIQVDRGTTVWTALTGPFHGSTSPMSHQLLHGSVDVASAGIFDETGIWARILNTDELDALEGSGTPPGYSSFDTGPSQDTGSRQYYYDRNRAQIAVPDRKIITPRKRFYPREWDRRSA